MRNSLGSSFSLKEENFTTEKKEDFVNKNGEKKLVKAKSQIVNQPKLMKNEEKIEKSSENNEKSDKTKNIISKVMKKPSIINPPEEKKVSNLSQTPKNSIKKTISGQKFTKSTNSQLIRNAIANVCLAGEPNKKEREAVLSKIAELTKFENTGNLLVIFKGNLGRQVKFETKKTTFLFDYSIFLGF